MTRDSFWSLLGCSTFALLLACSAIISGCSSATQTETIQKLKSPDGQYSVQVDRVDTRGPGNHSGAIVVRLSALAQDQYRDVAIFHDNNVDPPFVDVSWVGSNRLNIAYAKTNVGFQAIKFGLVEISYERKE